MVATWWTGGTLGADNSQHKTPASARGKRELDHFLVPEAETRDTELSRLVQEARYQK